MTRCKAKRHARGRAAVPSILGAGALPDLDSQCACVPAQHAPLCQEHSARTYHGPQAAVLRRNPCLSCMAPVIQKLLEVGHALPCCVTQEQTAVQSLTYTHTLLLATASYLKILHSMCSSPSMVASSATMSSTRAFCACARGRTLVSAARDAQYGGPVASWQPIAHSSSAMAPCLLVRCQERAVHNALPAAAAASAAQRRGTGGAGAALGRQCRRASSCTAPGRSTHRA